MLSRNAKKITRKPFHFVKTATFKMFCAHDRGTISNTKFYFFYFPFKDYVLMSPFFDFHGKCQRFLFHEKFRENVSI
jgi:hypothetical protein